jgi:hypothetical protein
MGIVKISDEIHEQVRIASKALDRSLNSQAEHWLKIGMLSELYREKTYEELRNILFEYEHLSIENVLKNAKRNDSLKNRTRNHSLS